MSTLANIVDPNEMQTETIFIVRNKIHLGIIISDPSNYTMVHPKFIYQNSRKNPLVHKGLNDLVNCLHFCL